MMNHIPTASDIEQAHDRIRPYIHRTPVMTSSSLDEMAGCEVFFKCENFQKVGAFKARGATNAVLALTREQRAHGVATHSSGNHAQALARAAKIMGIKSYIVMPRTAPEIKRQGVKGYGGEIFECEPTLASRESKLLEVIAQTNAVEIHPFNNYDVIAGQASAAKELISEVPELELIVAPVGGGGLLSGTSLVVKYFAPQIKVIGAEPAAADDAFRSLQNGSIQPASPPTSIADGLLTSLCEKTFGIIRENTRKIITVSEAEILQAMRAVWERLKIVIEPSSAVAYAVILKDRALFVNKKVGVILSGGNVDIQKVGEKAISSSS